MRRGSNGCGVVGRWMGIAAAWSACFVAAAAHAQDAPPAPTGAPPPDAKALVDAPKAADAPVIAEKLDGTSVSLSAGGVLTSGNSRLLAMSGSGAYETRFANNGFGASLLGNYGQGAPAGKAV